MSNLSALDWVLLAAYGAAVVALGVVYARRQRTSEDYTLGGRSLPWWLVGVSLIATSFSSAALVGGTGFGFGVGMKQLSWQIGDLLAIGAACIIFIPFFSKLGLTTAYEYLEKRFGPGVRCLASTLFVVQTVLRAGVLVLVPAKALSVVLGWDIGTAIVITGAASILYSATGGLAAVVWTDLVQFAIIVVGVAASLFLVAGDVPGGLAAVVESATAAGRMTVVDTDLPVLAPYSLPWTLLAYGTLAFSVAATNQQAVQRYLACENASAARRAAMLGWGVGLVAVAMTLFLGVCLREWAPDAGAAGASVLEATAADADNALPAFLIHRLPAGLRGLLVAAIFAASMSSMDSAIHSMSTATLVDFVRRFRRKALSDAGELRLARWLTVSFGVAATVAGWVAARDNQLIVNKMITWLGYAAGPLLGVFLLAALVPRATGLGALYGLLVAVGVVVAAILGDAPKEMEVHALWLAPISCVVTVIVGVVVSLLDARPPRERVDGLCLGR